MRGFIRKREYAFKTERGNILFLILLAVVLFAALTYAVTSSMRGGGKSGSSENASALAAMLDQEVSRMKTGIMRLELMDDYKQIVFNASAPTTSGTCYNGDVVITPCKTIGLFHSSTGVNPPLVDEKLKDPRYNPPTTTWQAQYWLWGMQRITINNVDIGTSAPDIYIAANVLSKEVCEAINKNVNNDPTIGIRTGVGTGTYPIMYYQGVPPLFTIAYTNNEPQINLANAGCTRTNNGYSVYQAIYIIKEN